MSLKSKGINAERDLVHKFWEVGWACIRVAGSGNSQFPSPDVLAGNALRKIAIECKVSGSEAKYFQEEEIEQLKTFAKTFGAEPWVAVKFLRTPWMFFSLEDLGVTGKGYVIDKKKAEMTGLSFEEVIGR